MKGKTTAILLASVLASPLALITVAKASELEAEMRFRDTVTRAEAEVEVGQKTTLTGPVTRLSVEFGVIQNITGKTATVPGAVDLALTAGAVACSMSATTDPVIKTFVSGTQTFQSVLFHGSFLAPPATQKGLDCTGDITTLSAGDAVTLTVTGLQPDVTFPASTLQQDD